VIFFDIDDTILDHDTAQTSAATFLFRQNSILHNFYTEEEFPAIWDGVTEKYVRQYIDGKLSFQEQRQERLKTIFREPVEKDVMDALFQTYLTAYEENWQLFPDVLPILEKYKEIPKGIISNGDKVQQRQKLKKTGIEHYFETVVISDDIGVYKPDPELFLHACKLAGKNPSDCYYIGDKVDTDAKAAVDAGLRGVWLNRKFIEGKKERVPEILSLSDFNYIQF